MNQNFPDGLSENRAAMVAEAGAGRADGHKGQLAPGLVKKLPTFNLSAN